jgi:hypothetical protein
VIPLDVQIDGLSCRYCRRSGGHCSSATGVSEAKAANDPYADPSNPALQKGNMKLEPSRAALVVIDPQGEVLPMCPEQSVTYVSERSNHLHHRILLPRPLTLRREAWGKQTQKTALMQRRHANLES